MSRPTPFSPTHAPVLTADSTVNERALHAQVANLQSALVNSRTIGTAIGILMSHRQLTRDQAFEVIRAASQATNRKVAQLAQQIVDEGDLSVTPHGPGNSRGHDRARPNTPR